MRKTCSQCKKEKNLEQDFYKDNSSVTGYRSYCKSCAKEMSRISQEKHLKKKASEEAFS